MIGPLARLTRARNGQKIANRYFSGEIKSIKKFLTFLSIMCGVAIGLTIALYLWAM